MSYSNDPEWRKFMDQKWKEMEQNRVKPSNSDMLMQGSSALQFMQTTPKKKEKPPATIKKSPVPLRRPMPKASSSKAHGAAPRISKPTIAEMGSRRRAIGAKQNPTTEELKEYHNLSNKIEKELTDRQVNLNEDWKKS